MYIKVLADDNIVWNMPILLINMFYFINILFPLRHTQTMEEIHEQSKQCPKRGYVDDIYKHV